MTGRSLLAGVLGLCLSFLASIAIAGVAEKNATTLNVDLMHAGKPFSKDLLGVNIDTEDSLENNYKLSRYYESLGPIQTSVVRFPGGLVANSYHWAQAIGPVEKRSKQWNWNHTREFIPVCGTGEYLVLLSQLRAKGMISLNVCDGTVEEAAAWVAFCRGRIGDRRTIGVDKNGIDWKTVDYWAKKRFQETGLFAPVDVLYWELGNETIGGPKFNGMEYDTSAQYVSAVLPMAEKIRQIDPNVFICWLDTNKDAMKSRADLVDSVIAHIYTGWPKGVDAVTMWQNGTVAGEFICPSAGEYTISLQVAGLGITQTILQENKCPQVSIRIDGTEIEAVTLSADRKKLTYTRTLQPGSHTVQIIYANDYAEKGQDTNVWIEKKFTVVGPAGEAEHKFAEPHRPTDIRVDAESVKKILTDVAKGLQGSYPNAFIALTEYNRMECSNFDMGAALYNAETIRICSEVPAVKTAQIWEACSWNFGLMATHNGVHRPVYYAFQMMKDLHGKKVPARFTAEDSDLRVLATTDPMTNRFAILLLNFGSKSRSVKLNTPKALCRDMKQTYIHADSYDVDNETGEKIAPKTRTLNNETIDVPGTSISLITGSYTKGNNNIKSVRKVLIIGNSITRHDPSETLGWPHDNGMAATSPDKDFAHLVYKRICAAQPAFKPELKLARIANEANMTGFESLVPCDADLIIVELGDNFRGEVSVEGLQKPYEVMLAALKKNNNNTRLYCLSTWGGGGANTFIKQAAKNQNATFVNISHLSSDSQNLAASEGHFTNNGVNWHPGNRGMQAIADTLWCQLQE